MTEEFESTEDVEVPVNVTNQYALTAGENLSNHTLSQQGRGKFVRPMVLNPPTFRTRQEAFRFAAWLLALVEDHLPDEEGAHDFEDVVAAVADSLQP